MSTKSRKRPRKGKIRKALAVIGLGALTIFQPETFPVTIPLAVGILAGK